jgi:hypothetical protein
MLFRSERISAATAFFILGSVVAAMTFSALLLRCREDEVPEEAVAMAAPALIPAD